jgi:ferredoxin
MLHNVMDEWLAKRLAKYDEWLSDRKIPFASKVIPVTQSLKNMQWVLPTEKVIKLLKDARTFAVAPCACRTHYKRCNNPTDICIFINDISDKLVRKGIARRISSDEIIEKLYQANEYGLVHLTLYDPEHYPYAICSCCGCCCHDLQLLLKYGKKEVVAASEYIAVWDKELCSNCGICVDRCVFGARTIENNVADYNPTKCYGCGLCVTICPQDAINLERKDQFEKRIVSVC